MGPKASPATAERPWLRASSTPLAQVHDVALLDLDGTVYVGPDAVPGAPGAVEALRRGGVRPAFVTNNASRTPEAVAAHLTSLGIACTADEVVTSAQAGASLVAGRVPPGSPVLVIGGVGVREALREVGLEPVDRADAGPVAVLQGWTPELSWGQLAEGAYALATGLPWVATNTDLTIPTGRGIAPGNGSFVKLLAGATGRQPDAVAGKPQPPLLEQAVARMSAVHPLVIGDRLDTDIEGAAAVGLPSLLVLSGVTDVKALLAATGVHRPTYLASDISGLLRPHPPLVQVEDGWRCGSWTLTSRPEGRGVGFQWENDPADPRRELVDVMDDSIRVLCAVAWSLADDGHPVELHGTLLELFEGLTARARAGGA
jgi:glycerol 3-phosphatase-2